MGTLSLLQGIFPTEESNWSLLHYRQILYHLNYQGSPLYLSRSQSALNLILHPSYIVFIYLSHSFLVTVSKYSTLSEL